MRRKIFVTSRIENSANVQAAIAAMLSAGDTQVLYDWTDQPETTKASFMMLSRACYTRLDLLPGAEIVLALLPGGRGTHADLALCMGAQATHTHPESMVQDGSMPLYILHSENPEKEFGLAEETSYLYHHPLAVRVGGSMQALLTFLGKPDLYNRVQKEALRIGDGAWVILEEPKNIVKPEPTPPIPEPPPIIIAEPPKPLEEVKPAPAPILEPTPKEEPAPIPLPPQPPVESQPPISEATKETAPPIPAEIPAMPINPPITDPPKEEKPSEPMPIVPEPEHN